jgi:membrane protein implicated in regulation of membrane protease activity
MALACLRLAFAPGALSHLLLAGSTLAFAVARRGGSLRATALVRTVLLSLPALGSRVPALARGLLRRVGTSRFVQMDKRASLAPALIPAALGIVFAGVFALANPVVAGLFGRAFAALSRVLALPDPERIAVFLVVSGAATVLVRPVIRRRESQPMTLPQEGEASDTLLATARNSLVLLNIVFLAYNALDAMYLWAGSPPPGVTTQIYAHQGAFWLTVALLLVTVVLGVLFRGPLAFDPRALFTRRLSVAWIVQSGVITLGTFLRLAMHVRTSGMSDLRFVGALGTTLVALGLGLVGWKIRHHLRFRWLVEAQLTAFAGALALYAVVPTHLIAARSNVPRIMAGDYGPLVHMRAQGSQVESAAELLPLLDHPDIRVRQGVAVILQRESASLGPIEAPSSSSYAHLAAGARLAEAEAKIADVIRGVSASDMCPGNILSTFDRLVDATVDGSHVPTQETIPPAAPGECQNHRSY